MIERTDLVPATQHLVLELGHVLLRGGAFRERPRQYEFGLEHRAGFLD
jgi:hypothetical protein